MQIDLAQHLDALLHGHVGLIRRGEGFQPVRLPPGERRLFDPLTRWMAAMTAGIRLRLVTDSRRLRIVTTQRQAYTIRPNQWPARYELFVDGAPAGRFVAAGGAYRAPEGPLVGDEAAVLDLAGWPPGKRRIELWFPQGATVALRALEADDGAHIAPWPDPRPVIVFHGSSITHGVEVESGTRSWPSVAAGLAGAQAVNLGWGGSCLISGLAARIVRDRPADRIVLELGINVWEEGLLKERTFADAARSMLAIIREGQPETPITVVSPIASPAREAAGEAGGLSLQRMRALLEGVVADRVAIGDDRIGYLSGLDLLGPDEARSLPDGLHPNWAAYRRIGERFYATVLRTER
ncbi:GDSL-type esterase/lipase family protein [Methylobacterium nigriterrae]|uniref:GDSL-type esterase/lipase family protein n=1 Tax=Methylobacterium nigriterrae TaxID=3127512 RepID=UPI003013FDEE